MLLFVNPLVVKKGRIDGVQNYWLLEITKKLLDETCYEMGIGNLLKVVIIPLTKLSKSLIFLIN